MCADATFGNVVSAFFGPKNVDMSQNVGNSVSPNEVPEELATDFVTQEL